MEYGYYCFDVLESQLNNSDLKKSYDFGLTECPMFVTWNLNGRLRGCIGTFSKQSLKEGLKDFALRSAFHDPRFDPIAIHELEFLSCTVSLLDSFEDCATCFDWSMDLHGIIIEFEENLVKYHATYLPLVGKSMGYTQEETIQSLIRKSGYQKQIYDGMMDSIKAKRYLANKTTVSYAEYCSQ